jgi:hypothetical protein
MFSQTIGDIKKTAFGGLFLWRKFADALWFLLAPVRSHMTKR